MADSNPDHRHRLLEAMARSVAAKGYAAVTIADLAAEARVSKRSFYEHFSDKAECFAALYEAASLNSLRVLREALDVQRDWHAQVEQALAAYLGHLAGNPALLATLFIDIMALGPGGLAARRRSTQRFADFIVAVAGPALGREQAVAIVGGIHEWVLEAVEAGQIERLPALAGPGARLVRAVIDGQP
ncbi:helix-turn-helix domain-containing protein [Ideonella sp. DXS22W]|uniref:Helix-turn-helix domain-containing protein n=1 Tax=Pseudaquabacterium inlustre TaxID=2984192 RepID=A0ABU9CG55_9BURK